MEDVEVYIVQVEVHPPVTDEATTMLYVAIAISREEAISQVQEAIPAGWRATNASKGRLSADKVESYGLRSGKAHRL